MVLSHGSKVISLAVLADGRLVSGGDDGKIKLWLVDEQKLIAALCLRAGRNLTKDEWARYVDADTPATELPQLAVKLADRRPVVPRLVCRMLLRSRTPL